MGNRCVLKQCPYFKNRPKENNQGFRCHKFPKDAQYHKLWVDWIIEKHVVGITKIGAHSSLCSAHFTEESYCPGTTRLKKTAVPSIAPQLTPDVAFKLGMISTREDFHQLPLAVRSNLPAGKDIASSSTSMDSVPLRELHDVNVRFQNSIKNRRLLDTNGGNVLSDCAENVQMCSVPLVDADSSPVEADSSPGDADVSLDVSNVSLIQEMPEVVDCPSAKPVLVSPILSYSVLSDLVVEGVHNGEKGTIAVFEHDDNDGKISNVTPVTGKRNRIAYVGDITAANFTSPQNAERSLAVVQNKYKSLQTRIKSLQQALRRSRERNRYLKSLLQRNRNNDAALMKICDVCDARDHGKCYSEPSMSEIVFDVDDE